MNVPNLLCSKLVVSQSALLQKQSFPELNFSKVISWGWSTIPTVQSIVMKFGKTQVGKTVTLEKFNFGNNCFVKVHFGKQ